MEEISKDEQNKIFCENILTVNEQIKSSSKPMIIILGPRSSGKSTMANYLLGHKIEKKDRELTLRDEKNIPERSKAKIGKSRMALETTSPKMMTLDDCKYSICDTPAYSELGPQEQQALASKICTDFAIHRASAIKAVMYMFPYSDIINDNRLSCDKLLKILPKLSEFMAGQKFKYNGKYHQNIFFCINVEENNKDLTLDEIIDGLDTFQSQNLKPDDELSQLIDFIATFEDNFIFINPIDDGDDQEKFYEKIEKVQTFNTNTMPRWSSDEKIEEAINLFDLYYSDDSRDREMQSSIKDLASELCDIFPDVINRLDLTKTVFKRQINGRNKVKIYKTKSDCVLQRLYDTLENSDFRGLSEAKKSDLLYLRLIKLIDDSNFGVDFCKLIEFIYLISERFGFDIEQLKDLATTRLKKIVIKNCLIILTNEKLSPMSIDVGRSVNQHTVCALYYTLNKFLMNKYNAEENDNAIIKDFNAIAKLFEASEFLINRAFVMPDELQCVKSKAKLSPTSTLGDDYARSNYGDSALGAAAYNYDLLRFIMRNIYVTDKYYSIYFRRPDLLDLPLNEKHAAKLFPTISIINYVLSRHLAPYQFQKNSKKLDRLLMRKKTLDSKAPRNRAEENELHQLEISLEAFQQGDLKTKSLTSHNYKRYMDHYVYTALKQIGANNVFFMPFEQSFKKVESLLSSQKLSLYEICGQFFKHSKLQPNRISFSEALLFLGIHWDSYSVLTSTKPLDMNIPKNTKHFCKETHITYDELSELFNLVNNSYKNSNEGQCYITKRINQASANSVLKIGLDRKKGQEAIEGLTHNRLYWIGVYNYFKKQLNWSYIDTNTALFIVEQDSCTEYKQEHLSHQNFLDIAHVKMLRDKVGISLENMSCLYLKQNSYTEEQFSKIKYAFGQTDEYIYISQVLLYFSITQLQDYKRCSDIDTLITAIKNNDTGKGKEEEYEPDTVSPSSRLLEDVGNKKIIKWLKILSSITKFFPTTPDIHMVCENQIARLLGVTGLSLDEIDFLVHIGSIFNVLMKCPDSTSSSTKFLKMLNCLSLLKTTLKLTIQEIIGLLALPDYKPTKEDSNIFEYGLDKLLKFYTSDDYDNLYDKETTIGKISSHIISIISNRDLVLDAKLSIPKVLYLSSGNKYLRMLYPELNKEYPNLNKLYSEDFKDETVAEIVEKLTGILKYDSNILKRLAVANNMAGLTKFTSKVERNEFIERFCDFYFRYFLIVNDLHLSQDASIGNQHPGLVDKNYDDIEIFIKLMTSDNTDSMNISFRTIKALLSLKKSQKVFNDYNNKLVSLLYYIPSVDDECLKRRLTDAIYVLLKWPKYTQNENFVMRLLNCVNNMSSISDIIDQLDKFTSLRSLAMKFGDHFNFIYDLNTFFDGIENFQDGDRVTNKQIAKLLDDNSHVISEKLEKIILEKDSELYDSAIRGYQEQVRDVLVHAVINNLKRKGLEFDTPDKLSQYLLIDIQTSGADSLSPIVQANLSLQWYIQRCRTGVENKIENPENKVSINIDSTYWTWLKSYRTWEANRKIVLYPENYLDPTARVNQSDQIKLFLRDIQQTQLSEEHIEAAFRTYLTNLIQLSKLKVCATCQRDISVDGKDLKEIYFIASTNTQPTKYYFRTVQYDEKASAYRNWGYWKAIDCKLPQGSSNINMRTLYFYDRLFLFWSEVTEIGREGEKGAEFKSKVELYSTFKKLNNDWSAPQLVSFSEEGSDKNAVLKELTITVKFTNGSLSINDNKIGNDGLKMLEESGAGMAEKLEEADHDYVVDETHLKHHLEATNKVAAFCNSLVQSLSVCGNNLTDMFIYRCESSLAIDDAFGGYIWEFMYFAPILLANQLRTNQQFELAKQWYETNFQPFADNNRLKHDTFNFEPLSNRRDNLFGQLVETKVLDLYHQKPFDAHAQSALRILPYKKYLVMQYMRNLLAWGDKYFGFNTREKINEALRFYLLAYDLLGDKPRALISVKQNKLKLFAGELLAQNISYPFVSKSDIIDPQPKGQKDKLTGQLYPVNYIESTYFALPENKEFIKIWDELGDRLYKIRHSLSIEGLKQQLPLFAPEIDPHALVRALAQSDANLEEILETSQAGGERRPHYRYNILRNYANEFTRTIIQLGEAVLSAYEKQDLAKLTELNNQYEVEIVPILTKRKVLQINLEENALEQICAQKEVIECRRDRYKKYIEKGMNSFEKLAIILDTAATVADTASSVMQLSSSGAALVPTTGTAGISSPVILYGGSNVSSSLQTAASASSIVGRILHFASSQMIQQSGYQRRTDDWKLQRDLAVKELNSIGKQYDAVKLRLEAAKLDYDSFMQMIEHQKLVHDYYQSRFTSLSMYRWMTEQLAVMHKRAFNMAVGMATSAEEAFKFELAPIMRKNKQAFKDRNWSSFWQNSRHGLLAGKGLLLELQDMGNDYLENNQRLQYAKKIISVKNLDEFNGKNIGKILTKEEHGAVSFNLKKAFAKSFDCDSRCIKMVSVTVPALASPFQQVELVLAYGDDLITISSGIEDNGMPAQNPNDSRYLPFEGLDPCEGSWTISCPSQEFDDATKTLYQSVTDIIITIHYTFAYQNNVKMGM